MEQTHKTMANDGFKLGQRLRRWPRLKPSLASKSLRYKGQLFFYRIRLGWSDSFDSVIRRFLFSRSSGAASRCCIVLQQFKDTVSATHAHVANHLSGETGPAGATVYLSKVGAPRGVVALYPHTQKRWMLGKRYNLSRKRCLILSKCCLILMVCQIHIHPDKP